MRVADTTRARLCLWALVVLASAAGLRAEAPVDRLYPVLASDGACGLALHAGGVACPCGSEPGRLLLLRGDRVSLAEASPEDLEAVPGIGPARARAIVLDRDRNGPVSSVAELARVVGIGARTADRLRAYMVARGPACAEPQP